MLNNIVRVIFLLWITACITPPAQADSWAMPTKTQTLSANGHYRLTIIPRELESQLSYFEDKVQDKLHAGQKAGAPEKQANGLLERKRSDGKWETVWHKPLDNDVAPASALVSGSGQYVVTFDNWHSAGYGDNVIVIYGADGAIARKFALVDILPAYYVAALPRSVSSIWWAGESHFSADGQSLELNIVDVSNEDMSATKYLTFIYDIGSKASRWKSDSEWERASAGGLRKAKQSLDGVREYVRFLREPLLLPTAPDAISWQRYLYQATRRLGWGDGLDAYTLIFSPSDDTEEWGSHQQALELLTLPASKIGADKIILATPEQDKLVQFLQQNENKITGSKLSGVKIYVFTDDEHWPRIQTIMKKTGAEIVQVPLTPIAPNEAVIREADEAERGILEIERSFPPNL